MSSKSLIPRDLKVPEDSDEAVCLGGNFISLITDWRELFLDESFDIHHLLQTQKETEFIKQNY